MVGRWHMVVATGPNYGGVREPEPITLNGLQKRLLIRIFLKTKLNLLITFYSLFLVK
jgi:hypothetical protein